MADSRHGAIFADNFMRGFSFVDAIEQRKKSDARLETRLAEEKEERAFQRRRTLEADQQVRDDRAYTTGERARIEDERGKREQGEQAALNPDASDEDLMPFVAFSPSARAEMERRVGKERVAEALKGAQSIPGGVGAAASNQVTSTPTRPSLGDVVGGPDNQPQVDPAAAAAQQGGFSAQFDPAASQGQAGLETVSEEEFNKFSETFQKKGFFGKVTDVVAGQGAQTIRAVEDIVGGVANAPGRIRGAITGEDINPATQNVGQEFTGELNLPAEWTTPEEFEALGSPAEIQEAADRNRAIAAQYEKAGARASGMDIGAFSRQGAALASSDATRRAAIAAENRAVKAAEQFLDPATQGESLIGQLAVSDPKGATVAYLENRATLQGANPNLALQMDAAMLPVLDAAEADLRAELQTYEPDSLKGRQGATALANLHNSRNQVAKGQPSVSRQAKINSSGLKVGDQPRVQAVADTIFDPNRPVPVQSTNAAVNAASVVAGRITPNRRLNETQVDAIATLAQAGWIDKPTALSVMMTGAWPPGKDPNSIAKIQAANDVTYGITEGGSYFVIQDHSKGARDGAVPNREIGEDQIKWATQGIRSQFPNMEDSNVAGLLNVVHTNPGWVRSRFNVTSQEDMRKLGVIIAETKVMAGKKFAELDDGWFTNTKDAPTTNQILMDPEMRSRLATELEMDYTPLPEVKDVDGVDDEAVRQSLREGRAGPIAAENADNYTTEEALTVYGRNRLMELDAAGRLEVDEEGNITILPEQAQ